MTDEMTEQRRSTNGDAPMSKDPIDDMLHGVASQTATLLTLRELLIFKQVFTAAEWEECFAKNHRSETERIRQAMSNQRVT